MMSKRLINWLLPLIIFWNGLGPFSTLITFINFGTSVFLEHSQAFEICSVLGHKKNLKQAQLFSQPPFQHSSHTAHCSFCCLNIGHTPGVFSFSTVKLLKLKEALLLPVRPIAAYVYAPHFSIQPRAPPIFS